MTKNMVYGIGINDADYQVQIYEKIPRDDGTIYRRNVWCCPFYRKWRSMLERCYSEKWLDRYPSYMGCKVAEEWHLFSDFKAWMETQDWQEKQLDKDILGDGKLYSAETCCFIPGNINRFMTENQRSKSIYPLGVSKASGRSKKFTAQCCNGMNERVRLGNFATVEEAHTAYKEFKFSVAVLLSEQLDDRIAIAFLERYRL